MTTASFKCSQQELYTISRLGWENCQQHISSFTHFSPQYTPAFITNCQAEVDTAAALPDEQARGAASETLRIKLIQAADVCLGDWQILKRYITKAFPEELQQTNYDAAGMAYYPKAGNHSWEAVQGLIQSAASFIKNNLPVLIANQNMSPAFEGAFNTNKTNFDTLHKAFLKSEETASDQANAKAVANNNIYKKLIAMFLDGQEIFKNDETTQNKFIFSGLLTLIGGSGTAGLKGSITNQADNTAIAHAQIIVPGTSYTTTSDEDGHYQLSPMAAATYTLNIAAKGYQIKTISAQEVKTGTMSTLNIQLEPL